MKKSRTANGQNSALVGIYFAQDGGRFSGADFIALYFRDLQNRFVFRFARTGTKVVGYVEIWR